MNRLLSIVIVCICGQTAMADTTVKPDFGDLRGTWEGWGTSLCWLGNGIGRCKYESLFADLLFTEKNRQLLGKAVPGLGLNIARYNIGGCGRNEAGERRPPASTLSWLRTIEGYWIDSANSDPASPSWDWSRDANQR